MGNRELLRTINATVALLEQLAGEPRLNGCGGILRGVASNLRVERTEMFDTFINWDAVADGMREVDETAEVNEPEEIEPIDDFEPTPEVENFEVGACLDPEPLPEIDPEATEPIAAESEAEGYIEQLPEIETWEPEDSEQRGLISDMLRRKTVQDLTGADLEGIEVIALARETSAECGIPYMRCRCKHCGRIFDCRLYELRRGDDKRPRSCGCQSRKNGKKVGA